MIAIHLNISPTGYSRRQTLKCYFYYGILISGRELSQTNLWNVPLIYNSDSNGIAHVKGQQLSTFCLIPQITSLKQKSYCHKHACHRGHNTIQQCSTNCPCACQAWILPRNNRPFDTVIGKSEPPRRFHLCIMLSDREILCKSLGTLN